MKFYLIFCLTFTFGQIPAAVSRNIICYYDASSSERKGIAQFSLKNVENSLEFCTHIVYAYAGLNAVTFQLTSLNVERDVVREHFKEVTTLKAKYPRVKFLLSLGGGRDPDLGLSNKYLQLLAADQATQNNFIASALYLMRRNKFDGLDLAFQFPRNIFTNKTATTAPWKTLRNLMFRPTNATEFKQKNYKFNFSILVENLRKAFKSHDFMLTLTVLPNINASCKFAKQHLKPVPRFRTLAFVKILNNSTLTKSKLTGLILASWNLLMRVIDELVYFNVSALVKNLDFINLQTFDFTTPAISPHEASYTAPLFSLAQQGGTSADQTVDYHVNYWLSQHMPADKLNVGIAAYGQAWALSSASNKNGFPKIFATSGPAPASYITDLPGILTWTEICPMLLNALNVNTTGSLAPLVSVLDPQKDFVTYAFRPPDADGEHGVWISYDDPKIAAIKAAYVRNRRLGGVAIFDISLDDFHGICNGDTFPMLRYIKYMFL